MELAVSIVLFLVALFLIGVYVSRKIKSAEDWWIAGRGLGIVPLVGTYFATIISTASIVGYLGYYYQVGWAGWWNWTGTAITSLVAAAWFAEKIRSFGQVTLPDFLEARYGRVHSLIAGALILVAMVFFTCAQLAGASAVVTTATGLGRTPAIVIIGAVFIVFTVLGGMESVAWTDTFCSLVILVGVWILMAKVVSMAGGVVNIHRTLAQTKPGMLDPFGGGAVPLGVAISWTVTWGVGNFGAPQFITRFYAAKDAKNAALSQGYTGMALLAFYLPVMLIALASSILFPGIKVADTVTPTIIKNVLNPWLGGILMASILAAAISTADSVLLLGGTTFVRDLYQKLSSKPVSSAQLLRLSRIVTLIIGAAAILSTIYIESGVMWIQANMVGIMGSTLAVVVLAGFAWKRANSQGALAAMLVGLLTAAIWYALGKPFGWFPILPSIFTSLFTLVVVSLLTPAPSESVQERFFRIENDQGDFNASISSAE